MVISMIWATVPTFGLQLRSMGHALGFGLWVVKVEMLAVTQVEKVLVSVFVVLKTRIW